MKKSSVPRLLLNAALALGVSFLFVMPGACSLYRDDRCVVEEPQYKIARSLFLDLGSIDLVRRQLFDLQWRRCKINEAIYRIQKEFEVIK